jgi:hypothetical protein
MQDSFKKNSRGALLYINDLKGDSISAGSMEICFQALASGDRLFCEPVTINGDRQ